MSLINWDKPKKIRPTKEHNKMYSSDCDVDGTYVPNMSRGDEKKWKGILKTHKDKTRQVELRKTFESAQLLIIVGDGYGYDYKYYKRDPKFDMHVSMNGPLQLTFDQFNEIYQVVREAQDKLKVGVSGFTEREIVYKWLDLPYNCQVNIAMDMKKLNVKMFLREYISV